MCTLALFFKVFPEAPIILLSNRDELSDRPWEGPTLLSRVPRVYGPKDSLAGGTWLGVNEAGLLVTITNHIGTLATGNSFCSRGYVVAEALRHETAREAKKLVEMLSPECKAFTMLVADPNEAFVIDHPANLPSTAHELPPGLHAVTNGRFGDPEDVKARHVKARMEEIAHRGAPDAAEAARFLGDHEVESGQVNALCVHPPQGSRFGTVSSALVEIGRGGEVNRFLFAGGPPCTTPFIDATPQF